MRRSRRLSLLLLPVFLARPASPQGIITTIAGTEYLFPGDGKLARDAPLGEIYGVTVDRDGNFYLVDNGNHMVMRVAPGGMLTVIAGNGVPDVSGDGGGARAAAIRFPGQITIDNDGNLYFVDQDRVRKISRDGIITTVAGGGSMRGEGVPATSAMFNDIGGVAVDAAGNLYLSDIQADRVHRVVGGRVTTFAGGGSSPGDNGPATAARIITPYGLAFDLAGNLYIAESGNGDGRVRRVSTAGVITTLAGGGTSRDEGVPAATAILLRPTGVATDAAGNVYIADESDNRVRKVSGGRITTVAGDGSSGFTGDGGPATSAALNDSFSVAVDRSGNTYIGEGAGRRVRRVDSAGIITTAAGSGVFRFSGDGGPATGATLSQPPRVVVTSAGDLYLTDSENARIRRISSSGVITTVAGGGSSNDDNVAGTSAELSFPIGLTADATGNVYIADFGHIRRLSLDGRLSTIAGGGDSVADGVAARSAEIDLAAALAFDRAGNLYFAEFARNRVRRVSPDGRVFTVAGTGEAGSTGDGGLATQARLHDPRGLAVDANNNLFIAEREGHRVRRVTTAGVISTVAGGGASLGDNGPATAARLESPESLAFDSAGNLYIADSGHSLIRRVSTTGVIATAAGNGNYEFAGDGMPATRASLNGARGIAVDAAGHLYIADTSNHRIRQVLAAAPTFRASPNVLSETVPSGSATGRDLRIALTGGTPLPFTVSVSPAFWLAVAPLAGVLPAALVASVNAGGLAPGSYEATVSITVPNASPSIAIVTVRLLVTDSTPPMPDVEPSGLSFAFLPGDRPASQQLGVLNRGGGAFSYSLTASTRTGGAWLRVTPSSGTAPGVASVTADSSALAPGTYSGEIRVRTTASAREFIVPVTASVSRVPQSILVSQTGLTFIAVRNGGVVPSQQVGVLNTGQGTMNFTASASVLAAGPQWLSVSPTMGSATAGALQVPLLDIGVNPAGLTDGEFYGQVRIDAPGADNSPQLVSIVLNVLPLGSNPGPVVRPTGLIFIGEEGSSPGAQELRVSNLTAATVGYISGRTPEPPNALFVALPPQGVVVPDGPSRIVIQPDFRGLTAAVRRGTLTLDFSDGSFQTVRVLLVVAPRAGPGAGLAAHNNCAPASLQSEFTLVPRNFLATAGWPMPIETRVADNCGHLLTTGAVVASFSNGDQPVALSHLQEGRWSGTWTPKRAASGPVLIRVSSESANRALRGEITIDGTMRDNPNPPVVRAGGIVSAAAGAAFTPLAVGGLVSIYGNALADGITQATDVPLATRLGSTQVVLQGRSLPLLYVSERQINAIVPYDVSVNTRLTLVVRRGSSSTATETITTTAVQPGVFVVTNPNTSIADARSPARPGDPVVIYCEGLGAVDPPVPAGSAASLTTLSAVTATVAVNIGTRPAQVLFAGLTPGSVGLYQVNVIVPPDTPRGDAVPVEVIAGGQSSQIVTMAVR